MIGDMQVDRQVQIGGEFERFAENRVAHVVALRVGRELAQSDQACVAGALHLGERGVAAGGRVQRGASAQAVGVRLHALGIKAVVPRTGFRPLPVPAEQHGARHRRRIHGAQQIVHAGETLDAATVAAAARAKHGPMRFRLRRPPRHGVAVELERIKMHMGVDHHNECRTNTIRLNRVKLKARCSPNCPVCRPDL